MGAIMNICLLPVNIEDCMSAFKPNDMTNNGGFFSLNNYLNSNLKCRFSKKNQKYTPYIQSPFEILYSVLINQIRAGKEELFSDQKCVEILCEKYAENFGKPNGKYIKSYIDIDFYDNEKNVIKIKNLKKYSKIPQKMLSSSMILLQCYYALQNSDFQGAKRI